MPEICNVFISYRHANKSDVLAFCELLEKAEISYFRDEKRRNNDASIQKSIENGLANSKLFLAWYTPDYLRSKACAWEFSRALLAGIANGQGLKCIICLDPSGQFAHIIPEALKDQTYTPSYPDLIQVIQDRLKSIESTFGAITAQNNNLWLGSKRPYHPNWVGRADTLIKLHHLLQVGDLAMHGKQRAPVAITGYGGEGKTMLAQQYALRFAAAYPIGVVWISGATKDGVTPTEGEWQQQLEAALITIASAELELPVNELTKGISDARQRIQILKEAIDRVIRAKSSDNPPNTASYLWIVDDLPPLTNIEDIELWLNPNAHCIFTIREKSHLSQAFHILEMQALPEDEALELLGGQQNSPKNATELDFAKKIAESLGHLPLALSLASAMLESESYQSFYTTLQEDGLKEIDELTEIMGTALPSGHARSIIKTFLRSLDKIKEPESPEQDIVSAACWCLLRLITLTTPNWVTDRYAQLVLIENQLAQEDASAQKLLKKVKSVLSRHALIRIVDDAKDAINSHALMARSIQQARPAIDQALFVSRALNAANQWIDEENEKPPVAVDLRIFNTFDAFLPTYPTLESTDTSSNLGELAYDIGFYQTASIYLKYGKDINLKLYGERHINTLVTMNKLALALREEGALTQALELISEVFLLCNETLGTLDPFAICVAGNLGATLYKVGELSLARDLQEKVWQLCKQTLGESHSDALSSAGNLALTLKELGELRQARELEEKVCKLSEEYLGESHTLTLTSTGNLASTLKKLGELRQARELEEKVFKLFKDTLGESHPITLGAINNLAMTLNEFGELTFARDLLEKVMRQSKDVLGERHLDTLTSIRNLALTLKELGELKQSRNLQEKVLQLRQEILGEGHTDTFISYMELYAVILAMQDITALNLHEVFMQKPWLALGEQALESLFTYYDEQRAKHGLPPGAYRAQYNAKNTYQYDIHQSLKSHIDAKRLIKKPQDVHVAFASHSGKINTLEGEVSYESGAAIITGKAGDTWPVERAKFDASYEAVNGTTYGEDGTYQKRPIEVLAIQLTEPTSVKVGYANDPITGQVGDWLVQYGDGDFGIVSKTIFEQTYEILD